MAESDIHTWAAGDHTVTETMSKGTITTEYRVPREIKGTTYLVLDRSDGPAFRRLTSTSDNVDGVIHEEYFRDGKLFRADGAPIIERLNGGLGTTISEAHTGSLAMPFIRADTVTVGGAPKACSWRGALRTMGNGVDGGATVGEWGGIAVGATVGLGVGAIVGMPLLAPLPAAAYGAGAGAIAVGAVGRVLGEGVGGVVGVGMAGVDCIGEKLSGSPSVAKPAAARPLTIPRPGGP